jgi:3-oxoacyl-[acyl-carrier protein] reductase
MGKLAGRACVVTGGARGIGREIALAFARAGADIAVVDRRGDLAAGTAAAASTHGVQAHAFTADVSMEQDVAAAMSAAEAALGRIDVLVNNAGIITTAPLADRPVPVWDEMIAVNLRSVFLCSKAVLPGMARRRFGRIINISSQLGHKGAPNMAHYAAAKAAIIGFTRSLAREAVRDGINVNAICPGAITTELGGDIPSGLRARRLAEIPLGRFGAVGEIAPTAVLLASSEGDYFVGATMNLNGGDVMV